MKGRNTIGAGGCGVVCAERSRRLRRAVMEALETRVMMSTTLVSVDTTGTAAAGGAGESVNPVTSGIFSPDGRFVLFTSTATNLVTGVTDTNGAADLFLRDLTAGTTAMISVNSSGVAVGSQGFSDAIFSPDSKYLVFNTATANMVAGVTDTNGQGDLFVRDLLAGTTAVVTLSSTGTATGNAITNPSEIPVFSPDGKQLAFVSSASDLIAGVSDTGGGDVFLRNMSMGTNSVVSIATNGTDTGKGVSNGPVFSPDGRYIAFMSDSTTLVAGATSNGNTNLYVRDQQSGTSYLVTRDVTNHSTGFAISANLFSYQFTPDSESLIYTSGGANMVAGVSDTNGANDIFQWDAQTNTIRMLTVTPDGLSAGDKVEIPVGMSADGRYFAFTSTSTTLTAQPGDGDSKADLYVRDLQTNTTVSVAADASSSSVAFPLARFSPDNVHLLFQSDATNVVAGVADTNGLPDLFLYDLQTGVKTCVTINQAGTATGNATTFSVDDPVFSPDGRYLSFVSDATDLTSVQMSSGFRDLFLRDIVAGTTTLVTAGPSNTDAGYDQGATKDAEFTADNKFLLYTDSAFIATAITTPFNFNFQYNLYAFDVVNKVQYILSANAADTAPAAGRTEPFTFAQDPAGGKVLFASTAPDMVSGITDVTAGNPGTQDIFITTLPTGNPGGGVAQAAVSGKGNAIASGDSTPSAGDGTNFGTTTVGTTVSETFTVSNGGTAALTTSGLTVPAGYTVTEPLSASIAAGGNDTFTVRFDATGTGNSSGTVSFVTNDTTVNVYSFAITATANANGGGNMPDLTIEAGVTGVAAGNFVGGTKGGKATVKVFDRGTATAVGTVGVTFYASADGTLDAGDAVLLTVNKKVNLKVGKSATFSGKFNYPTGVADGAYFILAKADSADAIAESDETNNVASSAGTIGIAAPVVDLSGTSLVGKGAFKAGKNGTAALTVKNNGNVAASATVTFQVFLSPDNVAGNGDDVLVGTLSKHVTIKAGATAKITLKANLGSVLAGSYNLVSVIDSTHVVTESDEGNNTVLGDLVTVV